MEKVCIVFLPALLFVIGCRNSPKNGSADTKVIEGLRREVAISDGVCFNQDHNDANGKLESAEITCTRKYREVSMRCVTGWGWGQASLHDVGAFIGVANPYTMGFSISINENGKLINVYSYNGSAGNKDSFIDQSQKFMNEYCVNSYIDTYLAKQK